MACRFDPLCVMAAGVASSSHCADEHAYLKAHKEIPRRLYEDGGFDRSMMPAKTGARHIYAYPGCNAETILANLKEEMEAAVIPFKYHRFYVIAGSNRNRDEYDWQGAKKSANAVKAIVDHLANFLCQNGVVKVILPPPRMTTTEYDSYLHSLHRLFERKLPYSVYNCSHIVKKWYSPSCHRWGVFEANQAVMYDSVHINQDGYGHLQELLEWLG